MYEKLKLIKMLISTLLLSLLLISVFKSCAYADILDDVLYYGETLLEDSNTPSHIQTSARYPVKWASNLQNYFNSNNIFNRNEVVGLIFYFPGNQAWIDCVVMTYKIDPNFDNVGFYVKGQKFRLDASTGNFIDGGATTGNGVRVPYNDGYGILGLNYSPNDWNGAYLQNQYVPPYSGPVFTPFNSTTQTLQGIENVHVENFSRTVKQWLLGTLTNYDENTKGYIEAYNGENNQWIPITNLFWNSAGEVFVNNIDLLYYQLYRIYFYDGTEDIYTQTYGYYFLPMGVTYNGEGLIYSGDFNNIQPILENQEKNQNFWEKTYNTMFVPSGDKIENNIQQLKEHIGISGDVSGELLILNNIKNNSGDFIIKWDKMQSHFSINGAQLQNQLQIPSGEINFSKIERENETFQDTMKWVRILLGFSLIVLIIKQWWTLILKTLGLSTEIYEQHREEQERLNKAQTRKGGENDS